MLGDRQITANFVKYRLIISLRKTIEGYLNYFDFITFEKIISNQSIFVSDRTQQNAIFKSTHWLRYSTTPNETNLFTEKSQAIISAFIFLLQT